MDKIKSKNNKVICFDVDHTLVFPDDCPEELWGNKADFIVEFNNKRIPLWVHKKHIKRLKDESNNATIIVWSQQGEDWAEAVVKAIGLESDVDFVMLKPEEMVDDLPLIYWSKITYDKNI
jgi:hypothetical protein